MANYDERKKQHDSKFGGVFTKYANLKQDYISRYKNKKRSPEDMSDQLEKLGSQIDDLNESLSNADETLITSDQLKDVLNDVGKQQSKLTVALSKVSQNLASVAGGVAKVAARPVKGAARVGGEVAREQAEPFQEATRETGRGALKAGMMSLLGGPVISSYITSTLTTAKTLWDKGGGPDLFSPSRFKDWVRDRFSNRGLSRSNLMSQNDDFGGGGNRGNRNGGIANRSTQLTSLYNKNAPPIETISEYEMKSFEVMREMRDILDKRLPQFNVKDFDEIVQDEKKNKNSKSFTRFLPGYRFIYQAKEYASLLKPKSDEEKEMQSSFFKKMFGTGAETKQPKKRGFLGFGRKKEEVPQETHLFGLQKLFSSGLSSSSATIMGHKVSRDDYLSNPLLGFQLLGDKIENLFKQHIKPMQGAYRMLIRSGGLRERMFVSLSYATSRRAGFVSELPDPNTDGLFTSMYRVLALIYLHSRFDSDERNKLMMEHNDLLRSGFDISTHGKKGVPSTKIAGRITGEKGAERVLGIKNLGKTLAGGAFTSYGASWLAPLLASMGMGASALAPLSFLNAIPLIGGQTLAKGLNTKALPRGGQLGGPELLPYFKNPLKTGPESVPANFAGPMKNLPEAKLLKVYSDENIVPLTAKGLGGMFSDVMTKPGGGMMQSTLGPIFSMFGLKTAADFEKITGVLNVAFPILLGGLLFKFRKPLGKHAYGISGLKFLKEKIMGKGAKDINYQEKTYEVLRDRLYSMDKKMSVLIETTGSKELREETESTVEKDLSRIEMKDLREKYGFFAAPIVRAFKHGRDIFSRGGLPGLMVRGTKDLIAKPLAKLTGIGLKMGGNALQSGGVWNMAHALTSSLGLGGVGGTSLSPMSAIKSMFGMGGKSKKDETDIAITSKQKMSKGFIGSDGASLLESNGLPVRLVFGNQGIKTNSKQELAETFAEGFSLDTLPQSKPNSLMSAFGSLQETTASGLAHAVGTMELTNRILALTVPDVEQVKRSDIGSRISELTTTFQKKGKVKKPGVLSRGITGLLGLFGLGGGKGDSGEGGHGIISATIHGFIYGFMENIVWKRILQPLFQKKTAMFILDKIRHLTDLKTPIPASAGLGIVGAAATIAGGLIDYYGDLASEASEETRAVRQKLRRGKREQGYEAARLLATKTVLTPSEFRYLKYIGKDAQLRGHFEKAVSSLGLTKSAEVENALRIGRRESMGVSDLMSAVEKDIQNFGNKVPSTNEKYKFLDKEIPKDGISVKQPHIRLALLSSKDVISNDLLKTFINLPMDEQTFSLYRKTLKSRELPVSDTVRHAISTGIDQKHWQRRYNEYKQNLDLSGKSMEEKEKLLYEKFGKNKPEFTMWENISDEEVIEKEIKKKKKRRRKKQLMPMDINKYVAKSKYVPRHKGPRAWQMKLPKQNAMAELRKLLSVNPDMPISDIRDHLRRKNLHVIADRQIKMLASFYKKYGSDVGAYASQLLEESPTQNVSHIMLEWKIKNKLSKTLGKSNIKIPSSRDFMKFKDTFREAAMPIKEKALNALKEKNVTVPTVGELSELASGAKDKTSMAIKNAMDKVSRNSEEQKQILKETAKLSSQSVMSNVNNVVNNVSSRAQNISNNAPSSGESEVYKQIMNGVNMMANNAESLLN